jgi:hypothetical protein
MIGMSHIAKPEFYADVKAFLDSVRQEDYVIYYEGLTLPDNIDSLQLDTLHRKLRKVIGFYLTSYKDETNKSLPPQWNSKKYIEQDYAYLGIYPDSAYCFHGDYQFDELIAKYEQDKGEIVLTEYDWRTSLSDKYKPRKSKPKTTYDGNRYLMRTMREDKLINSILQSGNKKVVIVYGSAHRNAIDFRLFDSLHVQSGWKTYKNK